MSDKSETFDFAGLTTRYITESSAAVARILQEESSAYQKALNEAKNGSFGFGALVKHNAEALDRLWKLPYRLTYQFNRLARGGDHVETLVFHLSGGPDCTDTQVAPLPTGVEPDCTVAVVVLSGDIEDNNVKRRISPDGRFISVRLSGLAKLFPPAKAQGAEATPTNGVSGAKKEPLSFLLAGVDPAQATKVHPLVHVIVTADSPEKMPDKP